MELTAVCEALERVTGAIEVRTDTPHIEKCFNEGWHIRWRRDDKWRTTKGPVKNRDLWERLFALVEDDTRDVSFVRVKGHSTEANNNVVDRLAREASESHAENGTASGLGPPVAALEGDRVLSAGTTVQQSLEL
jgi:ribonuclease HI